MVEDENPVAMETVNANEFLDVVGAWSRRINIFILDTWRNNQ